MNWPRIAVVGSYATGLTMRVSRIPCAGETLLGSGYRVDFGGKGSNQAVACARLGAQVNFVAKIGNDSFAEKAVGLYRDERIDTTHIIQTDEAPTGVGFIVVEEVSGQNSIVLDPGANELLRAADVESAAAAIDGARVVLTQLEIPVAAAESALVRGRAASAITILNPAPVRLLPPSILHAVDILTPNETEAKVLVGLEPGEEIAPQKLGELLIAKGTKSVVLTLGENGALLVRADSCRHFPAIKVSPVDTTGAGDAFNAGLATALAYGASMEDAVGFAVVIGGLAVMRAGVIPSLPRGGEVLEFYRSLCLAAPAWLTSTA